MANEIGNTEVSAVIQQAISAMVQEEYKTRSVLASTVMDMSADVGPGIDRISYPAATGLTAETKAENTALTKQTITFSNDTLLLDQHKAILVAIEDIAGTQSKPDVQASVIKRMLSEMPLVFDQYVYEKLKLASAAAPDHRIAYENNLSDNNLKKGDILEARRLLNVQEAPMSDRFLAISPSNEKSLLAINDFVHADKYGSPEGLRNGELGRLYGFTVIMSNTVEDAASVAYHREAVRFAYQQAMKFEQDRDIDNLADKYAVSALYGAKEMRGGKFQVLLGSAA